MINILMSGCNGKMGQVITRLSESFEDLNIIAGYDLDDKPSNKYPVYNDLDKCKERIDVIIDFSNPNALEKLLVFATSRKIPLVMATTGFSQDQKRLITTAAEKIPIFSSANMSLGINLIIDLVKKAAAILEDTFDIEIVEKHHNQKLDAPSGTALAIAEAMSSVLDSRHEYVYDRHSRRKKRSRNEIGIHAVRGGTIVGEHSVIFAGNDEIIEINHTAMSKDIFGIGALKAARFIVGKNPGMYSMTDLIAE